jgi:hypothetical protein
MTTPTNTQTPYKKEYRVYYGIFNRDDTNVKYIGLFPFGVISQKGPRCLHKLICRVRGIDSEKGINTELGNQAIEFYEDGKSARDYTEGVVPIITKKDLEYLAVATSVRFQLRESDTIVTTHDNPPIHNRAWSFYALSQRDLDYFKQQLERRK